MTQPRRRDWLLTTAYGAAGVGATLALWPFVAALLPADDVRARRVTFDLSAIPTGKRVLIAVHETPVMIYHRTTADLATLRDPGDRSYRDLDSEFSSQPDWARNWHRSLRPEFMICSASCTFDGVIVAKFDSVDHFLCPSCGSRYDLAGRLFAGPAPAQRNLPVPNHRMISTTEIEFPAILTPALRG